MTVEQLLKPRYKVIADWPGVAGKVTPGDIISSDGAINGFWVAGQPFTEDKIKDYPHLFRKLHWWEERKPEEMPEYVKWNEWDGHPLKHKTIISKIDKVETDKDGLFYFHCVGYGIVRCVGVEPATETEYNEYLKTLNP